jgi:hypothetical protein
MASLAQTSYGYNAPAGVVARAQAMDAYYGLPAHPAAAAPAPPAGSMAIPGTGTSYTPEQYRQMALNDPIYQTGLNTYNRTVGDLGTNRRAALQALALGYGGLPKDFAGDTYGDLTPDVLSQAQANPESTLAQMQRAYDAQNAQMQNQLAARGALHSGDLVQGQSNLDQQQQLDQYNAGQAFIDAISGQSGILTNYRTQMTGAQGDLGTALDNAVVNEENLNQPVGATLANLVPNSQVMYGMPVYSGPDGTLYSIDPSTGQLTTFQNPISAAPAYPNGQPSGGGYV